MLKELEVKNKGIQAGNIYCKLAVCFSYLALDIVLSNFMYTQRITLVICYYTRKEGQVCLLLYNIAFVVSPLQILMIISFVKFL